MNCPDCGTPMIEEEGIDENGNLVVSLYCPNKDCVSADETQIEYDDE